MDCLVLNPADAAQLHDEIYRLVQQSAGQGRLAVLCHLRDLFRQFDPQQNGFVSRNEFEFIVQHYFPPAVHGILSPELLQTILFGISRESQGTMKVRYDLFCHAVCYQSNATAEALTVLRDTARAQIKLGKVFRNTIFEPETTYDAFFFDKTRQLYLTESKKPKPTVTDKKKFRALLRMVKLPLFPKPAQKSILELISIGTAPGSVLDTLQVLMDHVDDLFVTEASPLADACLSVNLEEERALARRNFHRVPVDLNRASALGSGGCVYLWVKRFGVACTNQFTIVDIVAGLAPPKHEGYTQVVAATDTPVGTAVAANLSLWIKKLPGVRLSSMVDVTVSNSDITAQPVFLAKPPSWTQVGFRVVRPTLCSLQVFNKPPLLLLPLPPILVSFKRCGRRFVVMILRNRLLMRTVCDVVSSITASAHFAKRRQLTTILCRVVRIAVRTVAETPAKTVVRTVAKTRATPATTTARIKTATVMTPVAAEMVHS